MATSDVWTHGCDACDAMAPVEYVPPLGYLCAFCRRPESIEDLRRELRMGLSGKGPADGDE